jgi:cell division protein FtsQ
VITQGSNRNRSLDWEDEAPTETRYRRVQQGVPPNGRALPGMPLEMADPDGDDPSRPDWGRVGGGLPYAKEQTGSFREGRFKDGSPRKWWWPASSWGRAFLGLGALMVLGGLFTAVYVFKTYLERDARFRIAGAANIEASGLTQVTRSEMLPVFGEDIGRNIFFVPLAQRRKQLEQIPWVERATVMRLLPNQIRVAVVERQPVAFVREGQQVGLVDSNGVLLNMPAAMMALHHYSFPVVTGIDPQDPLSSRKGRMAVYGRLLAELDANNQHFSAQISEINLKDPEDAEVLMPEQGSDILAHFGEDRFLERYQRFQTHIGEWMQQYPKLAAVDLRYDQQVVLEMLPGSGPAQAAAETASTDPEAKAPAGGEQVNSTAKPAALAKNLGTARNPAVNAAHNKSQTAQKSRNAALKSTAAKDKAVRDKKKRAAAARAALDLKKQKKAHQSIAIRRGQ